MTSPAQVIDTETTGRSEPQCIEFARADVTVEPGVNGMLFHLGDATVEHYKPTKPIELGALATHHILPEELEGCPAAPASFDLPPIIIGHAVDYDWKVLGSPDGVKRIDTYALGREAWPGLDSYSLGALTYHLLPAVDARAALKDAHGAAVDISLCFNVFTQALSILLPSPKSWTEIWRVSEAAREPKEMPFGKHRGLAIKNLPRDYVVWLMGEDAKAEREQRQEDRVDPYLVQAFRRVGLVQ